MKNSCAMFTVAFLVCNRVNKFRNKTKKTCCILCGNLVYRMKKRISLLLSLILILGLTMQANAASGIGELYGCSITVGCHSDGISVSINTNSTLAADEIGCKDIYLVEKNGNQTKTIKINGGSEKKSDSYGGVAMYENAVKGRSYYAYCTHYAIFNGTEKTLYTCTDPLVFN